MKKLSPDHHGGWCWFSSPRAISINSQTLCGVVYQLKEKTDVNVGILVIDHNTGLQTTIPLEKRSFLDDHSAPSIAHLHGDTFLVGWTGHNEEEMIHLIVIDVSNLEKPKFIQTLDIPTGAPSTYVSIFPNVDGSVRIITRSMEFNPYTCTWNRHSGVVSPWMSLFPWRRLEIRKKRFLWQQKTRQDFFSPRDGGRPYVVYFQDGLRIYFALTPDHPRAFRNGVYTGYLEGESIFDSNENFVCEVGDSKFDLLSQLTRIFPSGKKGIAWVHDITYRMGILSIAYQVKDKSYADFFASSDDSCSPNLFKYFIADQKSGKWKSQNVGYSRKPLCSGESDYSGGISLSRTDPHVFALSSDLNPATGKILKTEFHSVFVCTRNDSGAIHYEQVSTNDAVGTNVRPIFTTPLDNKTHALLWLNGLYTHYKDYELTVYGIEYVPGLTCLIKFENHVDASFAISNAIPSIELSELNLACSHSQRFLEWGSGGSTISAIESGVKEIYTVETDLSFMNSVLFQSQNLKSVDQNVLLGWADVGPTSTWGYPIEIIQHQALNYVEYFKVDIVKGWWPDVALIDGRFRVACFLFLLKMYSDKALTIFWDDYGDRDFYHVIEDLVKPNRMVGRMAIFTIDQRIIFDTNRYVQALYDPR